jgi:hypothetical protein
MTSQDEDHPVEHQKVDLAELRRHLTFLAAVIARTEDQVADTLERLALTRPRDAERLLARARHARDYAELERARATRFSLPEGTPHTPDPRPGK